MVNQKHFEMLPQFRTLHVSVKEGERKSAAASTQPEITASHSSTLPRGASRKAPSPANAERRVTCNVPNGTNVAVWFTYRAATNLNSPIQSHGIPPTAKAVGFLLIFYEQTST